MPCRSSEPLTRILRSAQAPVGVVLGVVDILDGLFEGVSGPSK